MEPQIIRGLDIQAYHDDPNFTSHSRIHDYIERGPRYYFDRHVARTIKREVTPALLFGQAFETLLQEGEEALAKNVHVLRGDGRTAANKQAKAAALAAGRACIEEEDYEAMLAMRKSFEADCIGAQQLLAHAEKQVTLRGELCGLAVQSRPDWVCLDSFSPWAMDLKTTKNLGDLLLERDDQWHPGYALTKLGYHTQAALVRHLLAQNGYPNATIYLLIVEKQPSYRAVCVKIDAALAQGEHELRRAAPRLEECIAHNAWPRSPAGIIELAKPRWMAEEAQP